MRKVCAALILTLYVGSASGVLVKNGNSNNTQPTGYSGGTPFWDNIGYFIDSPQNGFPEGTVTYLGVNGDGEHWIITAAHLVNGSVQNMPDYVYFQFDSTPYATIGYIDYGNDIAVVQIDGGPDLPNCPLSPTTIAAGGQFTFCGAGWYYAGAGGTDGVGPYRDIQHSAYVDIHWARQSNTANNSLSGYNSSIADAGGALVFDSGSPAFLDSDNGGLSGIVTGGGAANYTLARGYIDNGFLGCGGPQVAATKVAIYNDIGLGGSLGDTDGDGDCDAQDLLNVKNHMGEGPAPGQPGDTNGDGYCNLQDLLNVKNHLGETGQP